MPLFGRSDDPNIRDGVTWQRGPDDFATRIEAGDVSGLASQRININAGTHAVMLIDGALQGVAEPGPQTLSTLGQKLVGFATLRPSQKITAIVVDTGDVNVQFHVEGATTRDPLLVKADIDVRFRVPFRVGVNNPETGKPHPVDFVQNVMKDRRRFTRADWQAYLEPGVTSAVYEFLRTKTAAELNGDKERKAALEAEIKFHLKKTFASAGIEFGDVRALRIYNDQLWDLHKQRQELLIVAAKEQFELDKRKTLFGYADQNQIQALVEETKRVENHEQKAALYGRMRRAVLSEKLDELRTDDELAVFLNEQTKTVALRVDERERLMNQLRDARVDRDRARAQVLARLEIEQRYELLQVEAQRRAALNEQQLTAQQKLARQQAEGEFSLALLRAQNDVRIQQTRNDYQREQANIQAADARARAIEDAKAAAEVRRQKLIESDLEREDDRRDGALGFDLLRMVKEKQAFENDLALAHEEKRLAVKRRDDFEREEQRLKSQRAEIENRLTQMRAIHDMEMEKIRTASGVKIAEMNALGALSSEAIIALSPVEQGALIRELKQTEAYKSMTEEQILALMAAKSPAVAAALTAKYEADGNKGVMSAETKDLYERLARSSQSSATDSAAAYERMLKLQAESAEKMAGMIRDTALGVSRNAPAATPPNVPTIFLAGGSTGGAVLGGPAAAGNDYLICPNKDCARRNPPEARFCGHCGTPLRD